MTTDRIKFLGNPWAEGRAIQDAFWSVRLESSGIRFDLGVWQRSDTVGEFEKEKRIH